MPQHAQSNQPEHQSHFLSRSAEPSLAPHCGRSTPAVLYRLVASVDGAAGADHALDRYLLMQTHESSAVAAAVTTEAVL